MTTYRMRDDDEPDLVDFPAPPPAPPWPRVLPEVFDAPGVAEAERRYDEAQEALRGDPGPEAPPFETTGGQGYLAGPTFLEQLLTTREFCAIDRPPPTPLCGPLLSLGRRLVVAGETGAGKSSWSFQLMRAICHELEFLGWKGAGGRGLILDFEQDPEDLADLFETLDLDESDRIDVLSIPHGVALDKEPRQRAMLEEVFAAAAAEEKPYRVVLLDPLYKVFGGDSSNERESVELMRHFDFWRGGADGRWDKFGLIVPMHARKPPPKAKFTIAEIFGSTAWVRGAENVYGIQFVNRGYSQLYAWKMRSHRVTADDGEDAGPTFHRGDVMGMTFNLGEGFKRGQVRKEKAADVARRLMSGDQREWTVKELMDAIPGRNGKTPSSRTTIDRLLKDMADDVEVVTTDGEGQKVFRLVNPDPVEEVPDEEDLARWEARAGVAPDPE